MIINTAGGGSGSASAIQATYETSPAKAAHIVGSYIYMNNLLYQVTAAIAIGDTIAVGTNVRLADDIGRGTEVYIEGLPGGGGGGGGSTSEFENATTVFNNDGSITTTYDDRVKNTVFNQDGSITETLSRDGSVYLTKTTTFNPDGSIVEEVV